MLPGPWLGHPDCVERQHQSHPADTVIHFVACSAGRDTPSSAAPTPHSTAQAAAAQLASNVITAPQLLSQLPATARKQLTDPVVFTMVMTALHCLASHQKYTHDTATPRRVSEAEVQHDGRSHSVSSSTNLRGSGTALVRVRLDSSQAALVALGNLAGMLSGERVSKPTRVCMCPHTSNSCDIYHIRVDGAGVAAHSKPGVGKAGLGLPCAYEAGTRCCKSGFCT